ncbi:MAG: SCO family protein [Bacteroidia bacterium]
MKKIGILVLVLFIPSVLYLWLQTGRNNFRKLEIFGPKEPIEKTVNGKIVVDTLYHTVGGFSLLDTDSNRVTEKIADGKITVVDFFFSTCRTICPKMSNQLMRVQHNYKDDQDVMILSFTVDPQTDTPSRLKAYAEKHKAIKGKWYFLTGEKQEIYELAKTSYFLTAMEGNGGEDAFLHSEQVVLIDKEKRIRGMYDGTDHFEVKRLIEDIAALENEYKEATAAN